MRRLLISDTHDIYNYLCDGNGETYEIPGISISPLDLKINLDFKFTCLNFFSKNSIFMMKIIIIIKLKI